MRRRKRRRGEIELAESLNRDAKGYEAETGAEPGEKSPFGGEMVAGCGAGVFEDGGSEAREHLGVCCDRELRLGGGRGGIGVSEQLTLGRRPRE